MKPQIITKEDIKKCLPPCPEAPLDVSRPDGYKRTVLFSDVDYSMFSERFLTGRGFNGFQKWLSFCGIDSTAGQKQYWRRNYDCDNLAESYKTYMNLLHAQANPLSFTQSFKTGKNNETIAQGVAVGVVYFKIKAKKTSSHHAINIAITKGLRNELVSIFIEPNAAGKIKLTKKERESIWYVNF
tara:strand:- start:196 stop:747 length:552 start_codon:yes stop_codon:yes gene_type:complete